MSKKTVLSTFISALLLVSALDAGAAHAQSPAKPELKVGFVPGPYIDGFKAGVAPELQKNAVLRNGQVRFGPKSRRDDRTGGTPMGPTACWRLTRSEGDQAFAGAASSQGIPQPTPGNHRVKTSGHSLVGLSR